ncbi:MAG: YHS domain-containing (seleno)protein [Imperialibacter sp.]|uniref:YHS domain-containing (seleno)protein n=1 Tax=Imperialibacter sp. TaxID=2038411 RepID=UPI003A865712
MRKILILCLALISFSSYSQQKFATKSGKPLFEGYDPVSYFSGTPTPGNIQHFYLLDEQMIYFSSESNREKFANNPSKYLPAYGGWCSISMAEDHFVIPDYTMYKIQDNQLHFFSVRAFFNGLTAWEKDPIGNKIKATANYTKHFQAN